MEKNWFIVKNADGTCDITNDGETIPNDVQKWGPYDDRPTAIARRVGLIRAGKCQPVRT